MAAMVVAVSQIITVITIVTRKCGVVMPDRTIRDKGFIILTDRTIPIPAVRIRRQDLDTVIPMAADTVHVLRNTDLRAAVEEDMVIIIAQTIIAAEDTDVMMIVAAISRTVLLTEVKTTSRSKKIKSHCSQKQE